jgi:hypothetical protein
MAKQLQLTVPEPCHEGWEKMTPSEKGRFCASCQKQVVDFSVMSDRQVAEFFKKSQGGSVCGHFMTGQLDRAIDIPKKRIPWVRYFFQFTLPAFLLSLKASAQKTGNKPEISNTKNVNQTTNALLIDEMKKNGSGVCSDLKDTALVFRNANPQDQRILIRGYVSPRYLSIAKIKGVVTDEMGQPLPGATLFVKGTKIGVAAGNNGEFRISARMPNDPLILQASYVGYEVMEIPVDRTGNDSLVIKLKMARREFTDGFVIISRPVKKEIKDVPLMPVVTRENSSGLRVFPNPVSAGANLKINSKKMPEGDYTLTLIDQSGQAVYQQETRIEAYANQFNIGVPAVTAGSYFLVLVNKATRKKFTEKIIIQ